MSYEQTIYIREQFLQSDQVEIRQSIYENHAKNILLTAVVDLPFLCSLYLLELLLHFQRWLTRRVVTEILAQGQHLQNL